TSRSGWPCTPDTPRPRAGRDHPVSTPFTDSSSSGRSSGSPGRREDPGQIGRGSRKTVQVPGLVGEHHDPAPVTEIDHGERPAAPIPAVRGATDVDLVHRLAWGFQSLLELFFRTQSRGEHVVVLVAGVE